MSAALGWLLAALDGLPAMAWVAMAVIIVLGSVLQAGAGIGFGAFVAPGTMLVAPILMPGSVVCLSFASALFGAARMQGQIVYREVAIAVVGRAIGAALAGWLIVRLGSRDGFALLFASLTLIGVLLSLGRFRVPLTAGSLLAAGTLSGLMATVTTIGGPPMALIYQDRDAAEARPTLNMFFAVGMIPPMVSLWLAGVLDGAAASRALVLMPAVVAGVGLSHLARRFIDQRYRMILLLFCVLAAVVIGGKAIIAMFG